MKKMNVVVLGAVVIGFLMLFSSAASAERWNFSSSVEGWVGRNGAVVQHAPDDGGRLSIYTYGRDPGMVKHGLSISASSKTLVRMRVATHCPKRTCRLSSICTGSIYPGRFRYLSAGSSWGVSEFGM